MKYEFEKVNNMKKIIFLLLASCTVSAQTKLINFTEPYIWRYGETTKYEILFDDNNNCNPVLVKFDTLLKRNDTVYLMKLYKYPCSNGYRLEEEMIYKQK